MTRSTLFLAAVAATAATFSFPALAQPAAAPTAEVSYSDLNLASRAGADALQERVARAARRVCTVDGDKSLGSAVEARACAKVAVARAMPQVELALANAGVQLADQGRLSAAAK